MRLCKAMYDFGFFCEIEELLECFEQKRRPAFY